MGHLLSKRKVKILPYILILPAFSLIILFRIYPILTTLIESFYVDGTMTLSVFDRVFRDTVFWNSFWITIKVNIVMIPLQVFISFVMALLVNATVRGITVFRTIMYLPFTLSLVVTSILWNIMLNPNSGVINSFLGLFGIPQQGFLIDANQALWSIVAIASWTGCAFWMMFLLAGLKNIDQSIYESARIDGANWLRTIISITLPLLKRVLLFVFVANTTANILLFVPMQVLTGGGPQGSTNVLMLEAYRSAFRFADRPRSSVIVMVLLLLIVMVITVQFTLLGDKDEKKSDTKGRRK